ncbi:MAG: hypothetical protein K5894_07575 [Lachnospiraceae bacterium]|nr:hypothetical protein [Lachnospiraceae bacterium]
MSEEMFASSLPLVTTWMPSQFSGNLFSYEGVVLSAGEYIKKIEENSSIRTMDCKDFYAKYSPKLTCCRICGYGKSEQTIKKNRLERHLVNLILHMENVSSVQTICERLRREHVSFNGMVDIFDCVDNVTAPYIVKLWEILLDCIESEPNLIKKRFDTELEEKKKLLAQILHKALRDRGFQVPYDKAGFSYIEDFFMVLSGFCLNLPDEEIIENYDSDKALLDECDRIIKEIISISVKRNLSKRPVGVRRTSDRKKVFSREFNDWFSPEELEAKRKKKNEKKETGTEIPIPKEQGKDFDQKKAFLDKLSNASQSVSKQNPNTAGEENTRKMGTVSEEPGIDSDKISSNTEDNGKISGHILEDDGMTDRLPSPAISKKILSSGAIRLGDKNVNLDFKNAVMKDKMLFAEIVQDEDNKDILLVFSPSSGCFYYAYFEIYPAFSLIKPFLEHNSCCIICYTPYRIFGTCMRYDVKVRNVISLFTLASSLPSFRGLMSAEDFIAVNIQKKIEIKDNLYFSIMPYYQNIFSSLSEELEANPDSDFETRMWLDDALGRGYNNYLFDSDKPLFKMTGIEHFVFSECPPPIYDGYFVDFKLSGTGKEEIEKMFRRCIAQLAFKGRFRMRPISIVAFSGCNLTLYIPDGFFDTGIHYMDSEIIKAAKYYNIFDTLTHISPVYREGIDIKNTSDADKNASENESEVDPNALPF